MSLEMLKQKLVAIVDVTEDEILLQEVLDILAQRSSTIQDVELTQLCMTASEKSLAEAWNEEEDTRWEAFLKD